MHPAGDPWWKRKAVWGASAAVLAVVVVAGVVLPKLRGAPSNPAPVVAKAGNIAPAISAPVAEPTPPAPAPMVAPPPAPRAAEPPPAKPTAQPAAVEARPAETIASITLPPAAKPTGRVLLAVNPWGEIYVDGKKRGLSPPTKELRLPPGKHQVEIRNGTFPPHAETIEVNADEAVRITHNF